ncbi:DUF4387 domain-containing protein [Robertmurraya massiliosenegalensis]|uniref:DUF4387 domain-containing protein n=1 Tax=Robertmurraya TaxID=2837507 RepID=UPI0039A4FEA3
MTTLKDAVYILRSKNAGPFFLTFDLIFENEGFYEQAKNANIINPESIGELYKTPPEDVEIYYYDQALSIKFSIPRSHPSGDFYDTDVFGAQQHVPLLNLSLGVN